MDRDLTGHGVLFDKDGTLFDFAASWASASASILRTLAKGDPGRLARMAKAGGFDIETETFHSDSVIIAGTASELHEVFAKSGGLPLAHVREVVDAGVAQARMVPVAGLRDSLLRLREAGARLAVVTNDSADAAEIHLADHDLRELFEAVVGYDSGYQPKPAAGSCLGAARELGVPPENCIMVGDSTHDLEAGRAAGMTCLGVLTGIAQVQTLAPLARAVLPSAAEVPDWLAEARGQGQENDSKRRL